MPLFVPKDRKSLVRQFMAGLYDAIIVTDPTGHIIDSNPRTEEHFGYGADEILDRPVSLLIPGLSPSVVQRIRRGLEQDRHMLIDANGLARDGAKFACEVTVSIIDLDEPGDLVFTVRNVERRRKVREMLRAKERAFEIAPTPLFICEPEGRFTFVNGAFCDAFGLATEADAREHVFADFFSDEPLGENFKKALEGETTTVGIVAETNDPSGDDEEVEIQLAPNLDGRKIRGVVGWVKKVG